MSYILNISTAVPQYKVDNNHLSEFYAKAVVTPEPQRFAQKLRLLANKTRINTRYSCIPDFLGESQELFGGSDYAPSIERRMEVYRNKVLPLACDAIDKLLAESEVRLKDITHLITVSCTGLFAPGLEFLIADHYGIQEVEKTGINFLGCYAAIKALKHAHYIAQTDPMACVLIVDAELCSLHFLPSAADEDIVSNLLFADGAAAVLLCGDKNKLAENKKVLEIEQVGSAFIPGTAELMKWELGASAFKMHLSAAVVAAIKDNITGAVEKFLGPDHLKVAHWAIHPGGVKIVEAVKQSMQLEDKNVADSLAVLNEYGNMSSPTVLFILKRIFDKIKTSGATETERIFSCAFGPGLSIELLNLKSVDTRTNTMIKYLFSDHAVEL